MRFEFSAGGIVFKKTPSGIFILLAQHSAHHGWVFPKGHIGDNVQGESKEDAALREVEEETGAKGIILQELHPISYWYYWEGVKTKKTVYYFLMRYDKGDITKHDFEMEQVEWIYEKDVEKKLTYPSDKKVWKKAKALITKL